MESITLTLSNTSSVLEAQYFPPLELLSDKNYVLGLVEFLTFHSIPNIDVGKNKFYIADQVIEFPTGSYEISDIEKYLLKTLEQRKTNIPLFIRPNSNTLRSEIKSSAKIDFRPNDSIATLLGFNHRLLPGGFSYSSDLPVKILKVNSLRIECNITSGAYINNQRVHTIHQFFPAVPPGYKIIEVPSQVIYLPVSVRCIDHIQIRIVDQDGDLVNFRGETITVRLHIKSLS